MNLYLDFLDHQKQLISSRTISSHQDIICDIPLIEDTQICAKTTLYLHDISTWKTPGKTLVFDKVRGFHQTTLSTRSLINHFIKTTDVSFVLMKAFCDHLNVNHAIPFVMGNLRLVPLSGTSKRPAHWIMAHQLHDLHTDNQRPEYSVATFEGRQRIHIPVPEKTITTRLVKARKILDFQYSLLGDLCSSFNLTKLLPEDKYLSPIDHRITCTEQRDKPCRETLIDLLAHLHCNTNSLLFGESGFTVKETIKMLNERLDEDGKV
ncbi:hypothetical protein ABVF11_07250 [Pediococcus argentinicus]|uniref:hypothetical protein n=1 Tax=Pediococcus argentinicus TaxID=480391 RepID=UPI00338E8515